MPRNISFFMTQAQIKARFSKCVKMGAPFMCHGQGANRICEGWLAESKAAIAR